MKANQKYIRSLKEDDYAVVHLSRLLAISIPFLIITAVHLLNAVGIGVPEILLEPVFAMVFVGSGVIIAVLGMKSGLLTIFLILMLLWALFAYIYISMVMNLV